MKKYFVTMLVIVFLLLASASAALADEDDLGYAWRNHDPLFTDYIFTFENLIDTHQQTRELKNGRLQGYIYIQFTGEMIDGKPVARRADCTNPDLDCRVGWEVIGIPVSGAKLVQKGPRIWEIDAANLPEDQEFTHFHWTKDDQVPSHNPKKPCGLVIYDETAPVTYEGYLFKRTAVTEFYWLGGNDDKETGRLVTPGIDLHSNLLGRWTGGGGHDGGHDGGEPGGDDSGGCGGHDGEEPGGDDTGGCGGHDGEEPGGDDSGGCSGHDGGEPGGEETDGCSDDTSGCAGH